MDNNKNTSTSSKSVGVEKGSSMDPKKFRRLIALGVVVVLTIFIFGGFGRNKSIDSEIPGAEGLPSDLVSEKSDEAVSPKANPTSSTKAPSITYQQALEKYGDRRIQFDDNCQARPNNVTYKNGTEIMLDNRANVSRKIKVVSTYSLSAYGFKIVKLTASTFPYTYLVDCGPAQNVATIVVQK